VLGKRGGKEQWRPAVQVVGVNLVSALKLEKKVDTDVVRLKIGSWGRGRLVTLGEESDRGTRSVNRGEVWVRGPSPPQGEPDSLSAAGHVMKSKIYRVQD